MAATAGQLARPNAALLAALLAAAALGASAAREDWPEEARGRPRPGRPLGKLQPCASGRVRCLVFNETQEGRGGGGRGPKVPPSCVLDHHQCFVAVEAGARRRRPQEADGWPVDGRRTGEGAACALGEMRCVVFRSGEHKPRRSSEGSCRLRRKRCYVFKMASRPRTAAGALAAHSDECPQAVSSYEDQSRWTPRCGLLPIARASRNGRPKAGRRARYRAEVAMDPHDPDAWPELCVNKDDANAEHPVRCCTLEGYDPCEPTEAPEY